ncbi:MAG: aspartate--tRNA ligase, partial [Candidatus Omnitrophota bacterium]
RYGLTQIKFDPKISQQAWDEANKVRPEWVLKVTGEVLGRPKDMINPKMETGEIEMAVMEVEILNEAKTPPFEVCWGQEKGSINEEMRLTYRYLDLRTERMTKNIVTRHQVVKTIRDYLDKQNFVEIETSNLIKGTPEGAREFIIPSRLHPGKFYVLPQSPQQMKQLLMVSGFDRYYQIAKCYRDEDQRGDRQPEFTQLDLEMSFVEQEDILQLMEALMIEICTKVKPEKKIMFTPFKRFTYDEAMNLYGSDKPELRFDMPFIDVTAEVKDCGFSVFSEAVKNNGVVKALKVEDGAKFSRKDIDELTEVARKHHAKGLAYITIKDEGPQSPIIKFLGDELTAELIKITKAKKGDIVFFSADEWEIACGSLGQVRIEIGKRLNLLDNNKLAFCWVVDFPLFKGNKTGEEAGYGEIAAMHHPFTRPLDEDIEFLDKDPIKVRSNAYDIVLNGYEAGGGSMRIHEKELQQKIFKILKIDDETAQQRFGHMLKAFEFGAPPHGGIAPGLDRLVMILQDEPNIREVMAFPKTGDARDLMLGAPSEVDPKLFKELHIKLDLDK